MNWTCPFCQRDQVVTEGQRHSVCSRLALEQHKFGLCGVQISAIACSNKDCGDVALTIAFGKGSWSRTASPPPFVLEAGIMEVHRLRPSSFAKHQPQAVPDAFARDYYEACAIRDLSPKASATLSRRVLQSIIRDFCGVSGKTLFAEITALEKLSEDGALPKGVATETIDAMHHIRQIGNIGAHMEADTNIIVDVEPEEAQALIELIEMLFEDWYVERAARQKKLEGIKAIAEIKAEAKKLPKPVNGT